MQWAESITDMLFLEIGNAMPVLILNDDDDITKYIRCPFYKKELYKLYCVF